MAVLCAFQGESGSQDYRVLSGGQDNTVRLWDPFEMVCLRVLRETRSELTALTFFAAGNSPITGRCSGHAQCINHASVAQSISSLLVSVSAIHAL